MTELHELNTEARKTLLRKLADVNASVFVSDDLALLLIANFLREISDNSHDIRKALQGIEMNTRPKL